MPQALQKENENGENGKKCASVDETPVQCPNQLSADDVHKLDEIGARQDRVEEDLRANVTDLVAAQANVGSINCDRSSGVSSDA